MSSADRARTPSDPPHRTGRRRRALVGTSLAAVLLLALAGCGASGGEGAKGGSGGVSGAAGAGGEDGGAGGGADTKATTTTRPALPTTVVPAPEPAPTTTVDPDPDPDGRGDTDLPPAIDDDEQVVPDGGGGAGEGGGGGGAGGYPSPVINGIPLDMSQPFDVGREWAVAANYGDFATVDLLSCANDARAVAAGQQHQASLAALRQLVAVRWRARDATSGWLEYSYQQVQAQIRTTIETPMILEDDGWKVCVYPQF